MQLPAQLHVKLSSLDLATLKRLARERGLNLSQTVRLLIRQHTGKVAKKA